MNRHMQKTTVAAGLVHFIYMNLFCRVIKEYAGIPFVKHCNRIQNICSEYSCFLNSFQL